MAEGLQIVGAGERADHGRRIQLPVAGVQDVAKRRAQRQRMRFRDRVSDLDQRAVERADRKALTRRHDVQRHALEADVLELAAQDRGGEPRAVDRAAQPLPEIGDGAEVILVRVGQHQAAKILAPRLDEARIGQHDLDPGQGLVGETDAQIDHQPLTVQPVQVEVQADLARSAERHEQQLPALHPLPSSSLRTADRRRTARPAPPWSDRDRRARSRRSHRRTARRGRPWRSLSSARRTPP